MTAREKKLFKIVMAPMLKGVLPLPTFAEWCVAMDELYPEMKP
jgi:hypothetical protein